MHEQEWKYRESDTKLVHGLMGRLAEDIVSGAET